MANPELFLKDQLPVNTWPTFPTILRTAYAAADDLVKNSPVLQIESADDNKGRFISWSVDFALRRAIELGSIPCDFKWVPFAQPTGRYLQLRFPHSTASVSQVADPKFQPRNVVFRENARLRNQGVLDLPEFKEEQKILGLPHFLLLHGYKSLNFAHFGLPSPDSKKEWSWLSKNLMNLPHEISSDLPPTENTEIDFNEVSLLKEDIERWRRDNGQD